MELTDTSICAVSDRKEFRNISKILEVLFSTDVFSLSPHTSFLT